MDQWFSQPLQHRLSSLFPFVFHCPFPYDTSLYVTQPCAHNPLTHTTHIHTMPCTQPKPSTFVRGASLRYAHIHTCCIHTLISDLPSMFPNTHTVTIFLLTISCPPSPHSLGLVWSRVCVTVADFGKGKLAQPTQLAAKTSRLLCPG